MKSSIQAFVLLAMAAAPIVSYADQLIPAGALIQCTVSEPKISSKTMDVGDPVLCRVNHVELPGRSAVPYGSYLVGHFEDYKDPGHLFGKGWMELKFDRLVMQPDTVVSFSAKVVDVPKYGVDKQGRIHGNGHPVRDTVEWLIPVLWPVDLINLPRRGPRPVLKAETRLTLKIMDDVEVPTRDMAHDAPGFQQRAPLSYAEPAPVMAAPPMASPAPVEYEYAPQPPAPPMPVAIRRQPQTPTLLVMRNGYGMYATNYWVQGNSIRYIAVNGAPVVMPMQQLDYQRTIYANQQRGVEFSLQAAGYQGY